MCERNASLIQLNSQNELFPSLSEIFTLKKRTSFRLSSITDVYHHSGCFLLRGRIWCLNRRCRSLMEFAASASMWRARKREKNHQRNSFPIVKCSAYCSFDEKRLNRTFYSHSNVETCVDLQQSRNSLSLLPLLHVHRVLCTKNNGGRPLNVELMGLPSHATSLLQV